MRNLEFWRPEHQLEWSRRLGNGEEGGMDSCKAEWQSPVIWQGNSRNMNLALDKVQTTLTFPLMPSLLPPILHKVNSLMFFPQKTLTELQCVQNHSLPQVPDLSSHWLLQDSLTETFPTVNLITLCLCHSLGLVTSNTSPTIPILSLIFSHASNPGTSLNSSWLSETHIAFRHQLCNITY